MFVNLFKEIKRFSKKILVNLSLYSYLAFDRARDISETGPQAFISWILKIDKCK
jgi:hypothetical protein